MQRIMIADGSDIIRKVGRRILTELNFMVSEASNALEAIHRCEADMPNILVVDAGMDGALEFIAAIRKLPEGHKVRIYYCVVEADLKKMMAGKRAGANDFLMKPFDRKILTSVFAGLAVAA